MKKTTKDDSLFILIVLAIILLGILVTFIQPAVSSVSYPQDLWKGLIAESSCNYSRSDFETEMYAVACVVKNRINKGMSDGLVSMKRNNLTEFVNKEVRYINAKTNKRVDNVAKRIVDEVFNETYKDTTKGSLYFEDIEKYGYPRWFATGSKETKIGTKTFWRQ